MKELRQHTSLLLFPHYPFSICLKLFAVYCVNHIKYGCLNGIKCIGAISGKKAKARKDFQMVDMFTHYI